MELLVLTCVVVGALIGRLLGQVLWLLFHEETFSFLDNLVHAVREALGLDS